MWVGRVAQGDWEVAAAEGAGVFFASWARVEPARGRYDEAELAGYRRAVLAARRRGSPVVVVVHAGALPDWQIARDGWLDPDALALWGCYVDRLAHALAEVVTTWIALWDPLGEAAFYDDEARRVGRVLLDAQAAAYLHLRRAAGQAAQVGAVLGVDPYAGGRAHGPRSRFGAVVRRAVAEAWVRSAATGRLGLPFALVGELPNGTPALDFVGVAAGEGTDPDDRPADRPAQVERIARLAAHGKPAVVVGPADVAADAVARGVHVVGRVERG